MPRPEPRTGSSSPRPTGSRATPWSAGVRHHDRVGIHLPKSVEMVIAVYGVLKAGAAYVPLDLKAPKATVERDRDGRPARRA